MCVCVCVGGGGVGALADPAGPKGAVPTHRRYR